jgi:hypothetical protein
VTRYLPTFKVPDAAATKAVRVRHLVSHTSGFVGDYFDDLGRGDDALRRIVARMRTKTPQLTDVGRLMSYNNAGFYVLGRVIEVVTGKRYEDLVAERIFQPLGMDNTFWFPEDVATRKTALGHSLKLDGSLKIARPWGLPRAANPAGGIVSDAVDQMKYAQFHLAGGRTADGKRLLKAATVRRMQKPIAHIGHGMADDVGVTWLLDKYKGAGGEAGRRPGKQSGSTTVAKHGGTVNGHTSEFLFVPSKGFALTVLTNGQRGHEVGNVVIAWTLSELLGLRRPQPAFKPLTARAAREYVGRYPNNYGAYVVTAENGGLLATLEVKKELLEADPEIAAQLPQPMPMGRVANDKFVVTGDYSAGARVQFFRDDGAVTWIRTGGRVYKREADEG